ncbi:MAG: electron transfer flavoprotein subunit beta/FixA family protein [Spirochaetota bacterium]
MIKILVCIKEVPHIESKPEIDFETNSLIYPRDKNSFVINSSDEYALEEGLKLKDEIPNTKVDVITAGSQIQIPLIRRALEMGADRGFILEKEPGSNSPAFALIAAFAKEQDYDLILTGVMSDDNMEFITGPSIAALLNYPWATSAISITIDLHNHTVKTEREIDSTRLEIVTLKLPALITVQSGVNRPRYPSLSSKLKARNAEIQQIQIESQSAATCPVEIISIQFPESKKGAIKLKGSSMDKSKALLEILRSRGEI